MKVFLLFIYHIKKSGLLLFSNMKVFPKAMLGTFTLSALKCHYEVVRGCKEVSLSHANLDEISEQKKGSLLRGAQGCVLLQKKILKNSHSWQEILK